MRNANSVEIHARAPGLVAWTRGLDFVEKVAWQNVIKREEKQFYAAEICLNA